MPDAAAGASNVEVSVVISTYDRCDRLRLAIESVLNQVGGSPKFELIVVDNNSTDDTRRVVEELMRTSANLRYVFELQQGVSHGRNAGIAHARAPIVAFTDDDVRVAPDWLQVISAAFAAHPEVDFVGGKVLPEWPSPPPAWLTKTHWAPLALTDFGDDAFMVNYQRPLCLVSANLAFRRKAFEMVGLFDPTFQHQRGAVSSGEDHDLELRLWRAGRQGMYVPKMVVTADVQPNRLERAYHRRWHRDHGTLATRLLRPDECYDRDGALSTTGRQGVSLFGVPGWAYRELVVTIGRFLAASISGDKERAFHHEGALREQAAAMRVNYGNFRRNDSARAVGVGAHLTDVVRFARAITARRHTSRSA
jgi:glycosyltransferase involved in cell wall biosynthesis